MLRQPRRFAWTQSRRGIVKVQLVRFGDKGVGGLRAHLHYIQRDGATHDGEVGRVYSRSEDDADGKQFVQRSKIDRHYFRLIVSIEDGLQYDDLRPLIRRLMGRMSEDLGTELDWVAADHSDTFHPHTHIVLRGKDGVGGNLIIAPDYMNHGMRVRLMELVSMDLGPKTELEIEQQLRIQVDRERLTSIDRRLLLEMDSERVVTPHGQSMFEHVIEVGRLRKLYALGLAEPLDHGRWRLSGEFEETLQRIGARTDALRNIQRALTSAGVERSASELSVYDAASGSSITGRIISRGIAQGSSDRNYLIADAIDGRCYYVDVGRCKIQELPDEGMLVRISAQARRAAHARAAGHHDTSIHVELLSRIPMEQLAHYDGRTWLDEELVAPSEAPRGAGFGREVRSALSERRSWLLDHGLASVEGASFVCPPSALSALHQRELMGMACRISEETGLQFSANRKDAIVEGILRRRVDGAVGAFAIIENGREFLLVPWRKDFETAVGQRLSGFVRENAISLQLARGRGPEI